MAAMHRYWPTPTPLTLGRSSRDWEPSPAPGSTRPGPHDVVVDLEADTQENITAILRHKIRPIKGITNTVTCIWC